MSKASTVLRIARRVLATLVLVGILACTSENEEQIAATVARDWTTSSVDRVSDSLGGAATGGIPGLGQVVTSVIRDQIRQKVSWTYSEPVKVGDGRYDVVATATAPVDIGILTFQRSYALSGNFELSINVEEKKVVDWRFDATSFQFTQR